MPRVGCGAWQYDSLTGKQGGSWLLASSSRVLEMLGVKAWLSRAANAAHHFCRPSTIELAC
jgi:hypothetical protein